MKAKFYKGGSIIKFDLLNMTLNLAPVSFVGDDGNTHVFPVPFFFGIYSRFVSSI